MRYQAGAGRVSGLSRLYYTLNATGKLSSAVLYLVLVGNPRATNAGSLGATESEPGTRYPPGFPQESPLEFASRPQGPNRSRWANGSSTNAS
jgi:hypothetical protein